MKNVLKVAFCDDEVIALQMVKKAVEEAFAAYGVDVEGHCYVGYRPLLKAMEENDFAILFLDIDMPDMDGIELAKKLGKVKGTGHCVFCSSREDRVFDSFSVRPYGFLRKSSLELDAMKLAGQYLEDCAQRTAAKYISLETREGLVRVVIKKIIYVECARDYQTLFMSEGDSLRIHYRMKLLEEQLMPYGFLRIHQGYIVNYRFIRRIGQDVELTDGTVLPVSRGRKKEIALEYARMIRGDKDLLPGTSPKQ